MNEISKKNNEKEEDNEKFLNKKFILCHIRFNIYIFSAFCCFAYELSSSTKKWQPISRVLK